ncbi:hypothetical protein EYF80_010249 [Liparis tanakae]|uniref:Uncharacterized protein n=1 Tax=Liparis tanakae TaxID=230148 RepID=A0A4Z2INI6_9TELE|nr:hypothetical protein EYF80_010249 [Liparis tanakae]
MSYVFNDNLDLVPDAQRVVRVTGAAALDNPKRVRLSGVYFLGQAYPPLCGSAAPRCGSRPRSPARSRRR